MALQWVEDGRDVILDLRLPGLPPSDCVRRLACRWAHGIVISLQWPENQGGHFLTWDTTFDRQANGTWIVRLDFADGEIRLHCDQVELLPP